MHRSAALDHDNHDLSLVAGHAAGDLVGSQAVAASALLAECATCDEVHRDLVAIAAASRALPNLARAPRDFRLTAEQAEQLRRGSWLRGLLRPFASPRSATRPLAAAFTSFGVAGLLVAAFLPGLIGSAAMPASRDAAEGAPAATGGAAFGPADPFSAGGPQAVSNATEDPNIRVDAQESGMDLAGGVGTTTDGGTKSKAGEASGTNAAAGGPTPLLAGSVGLLLVGVSLFGLRLAARRVR